MEKIESNVTSAQEFEKRVLDASSERKRIYKEFKQNAGIFVSVFLVFAVVVLVTTDISLIDLEKAVVLGVDFFLLLFIVYSTFVNCSDSGMRLALNGELYLKGVGDFERAKQYIIDNKMQSRLGEFCHYYTSDELKNIRTSIVAVVGISYDEYMEKYVGLDRERVNSIAEISTAKKKAINRTNKIETIRLTPEMIMKRRRNSHRRSPLGMDPETKKRIVFGKKFAGIAVLSIAMSVITINAIKAPSWAVFVACVLKLVAVVANGFYGYKYGYENIAVDTVDYMSDQVDLMHQFVLYIEEHPLPVDKCQHQSTASNEMKDNN